ncbi:MAG TPA: DNA repair protein RadC [bacterium]|nr:DNA repair protein RadC [bacterium]HPP30280.1 DNA repair protein RadC [bacterium]
MKNNIPIKKWPEDEKPREKLLKYGEHKLTDTELLAILIRTGSKGETAVDIARRIMQKFGSFRNMSHTSIHKWKDIKGLGKAKICQIKAAIEIGRRFREEELKGKKVKISGPEDVFFLLLPRMRDLKKEIFLVLHMDAKNKVFDSTEIEEGTVNQANPIVREIFYKAMENFSVSIVCVHNHPSGDPSPSKEDIEFTKTLIRAGEVLNIKVVDHIIIGNDAYYSFAKSGII